MGFWDDPAQLLELYLQHRREIQAARLQRLRAPTAESCARQVADRIEELTGSRPDGRQDVEPLIIEQLPEPPVIESDGAILARLRDLGRSIREVREANLRDDLAAAVADRDQLAFETRRDRRDRRERVETLATSQLSLLDRCPWCGKPVTGPGEAADDQGRHWHSTCHARAADLL